MKKRNKLRTLALVLALLSGGIQPTVFAEEISGNSDQPATETATPETEQTGTGETAGTETEITEDSSLFSTQESAKTVSSPEPSASAIPENTADPETGDENTGSDSDSEADLNTESEEEIQVSAASYSAAPAVNLLSSTENESGSISITYDSGNNIHYVEDQPGKPRIIVFCMNNELHWPHITPSISSVPSYTEVSFEEFFNQNNITGQTQSDLKTALENILYAGYPYNGYNLYEVVDQVSTISEADFNALLVPPQYLRDDFPDTIGNNTFTYADRNNSTKVELLDNFLKEVGDLLKGGFTKSGLTYQQITLLPFWKAAFSMVNFSGDPINSFSTLFSTGYYVTEAQAYSSTQDAIWTLLNEAGLRDNNIDDRSGLSGILIAADTTNLILTKEPSSDSIQENGNFTFFYDPSDGKWHTGSISVSAPGNYHAIFSLSLPSSITEESGKTQVKSGESFSLVSSSKPSNLDELLISATIQWMDPDLKVYAADSTVTAYDGKSFQNMIGAVIHKTEISKSIKL